MEQTEGQYPPSESLGHGELSFLPLRGSKAVKYFSCLDDCKKYHYIRSVLQPEQLALYRPLTGAALISLEIYPQSPWPLQYLSTANLFAFQRYDYIRRSILTATLFLQRPLTNHETAAVANESAIRYRGRVRMYLWSSMIVPLNIWFIFSKARGWRSPFMARFVLARHAKTSWTREQVYGNALLSGLVFSLSLPFSDRYLEWGREKKDTRLSALKDAIRDEIPKLSYEKYRSNLVLRESLKRPKFWDLYWSSTTGEEWQSLKYTAETFVDPPSELRERSWNIDEG